MFHRARHKLPPAERPPTKPQSRLFIVAAMVGIVTLGLSVLAVLAIVNRLHAQTLHDEQRLACLLVLHRRDAVDPVVAQIRSQYRCPPYSVSTLPPLTPSPSTTRSTVAPTSTAPPVAAAPKAPSTAPSRTVTAVAPTPAPAATVTAPRATVTASAPVATATVAAPTGGLVCVPALNVCL